MSKEPWAGSSFHSAGGTTSASQSSVPQSSALNPIQRLIHLASGALEVPMVDAEGRVLPKIWSWNAQSYPDCSPLITAIHERWGQFPITNNDLYDLRDGISWATCVGNRKFLQIWDDFVTELSSFQVDGLRKFCEELVKFIYDGLPARSLSPLHYAVLRNSVTFRNFFFFCHLFQIRRNISDMYSGHPPLG